MRELRKKSEGEMPLFGEEKKETKPLSKRTKTKMARGAG
jgi:hypothetical protein